MEQRRDARVGENGIFPRKSGSDPDGNRVMFAQVKPEASRDWMLVGRKPEEGASGKDIEHVRRKGRQDYDGGAMQRDSARGPQVGMGFQLHEVYSIAGELLNSVWKDQGRPSDVRKPPTARQLPLILNNEDGDEQRQGKQNCLYSRRLPPTGVLVPEKSPGGSGDIHGGRYNISQGSEKVNAGTHVAGRIRRCPWCVQYFHNVRVRQCRSVVLAELLLCQGFICTQRQRCQQYGRNTEYWRVTEAKQPDFRFHCDLQPAERRPCQQRDGTTFTNQRYQPIGHLFLVRSVIGVNVTQALSGEHAERRAGQLHLSTADYNWTKELRVRECNPGEAAVQETGVGERQVRNVVISIAFPRTTWIAENFLDGTYLKYKYHLRASEGRVIKSREFGVSCDLKTLQMMAKDRLNTLNRLCFSFPLRTIKSVKICKVILERLFSLFSSPVVAVTDNAMNSETQCSPGECSDLAILPTSKSSGMFQSWIPRDAETKFSIALCFVLIMLLVWEEVTESLAEYHKRIKCRIKIQRKDMGFNMRVLVLVKEHFLSFKSPFKIYRFLTPVTLLVEDSHSPTRQFKS
ncbi:hypothetical protein PR048_018053, partial [Dryococelus australis]